MEPITIKQIYTEGAALLQQRLTVMGWVRTIRVSKNFGFIEINDGTAFKSLQVVFEDNLENFEQIAKVTVSSALCITGVLTESLGAKQPFELKAQSISWERLSGVDYPLQKKRHSFEYLRTLGHLRARTNTFAAVFRIRSLLAYALHQFFQERGFVYVHTPIITGSDCEGAGQMFRVTTINPANPSLGQQEGLDFSQDFFGQETHLTVSGQLNGESYCLAFNRIYTFGPTFRAENSNTARHAAEFWMIEPEIAFADLKENMKLAEEMLKSLIAYILEQAPEEMAFLNNFIDPTLLERLEAVHTADFGQITYTEAIALLEQSGESFKYPVHWGSDLQTEHERYLTEKIFQRPVFVTDYPQEIKAFYMRKNDDGKTVAAMDLLVPGVGEIIGGSQREERLDYLEKRIDELGLCKKDLWWYLDLRRYGSVKHSGFGLGFERLMMYITGMSNIRDVIPFPRTVNNAEF